MAQGLSVLLFAQACLWVFMSLSRRGSGLAESVDFGMRRVLSLPLGIPVLTVLSELGLLRLVLMWTFLRVGVPFWVYFIFPVPSEFSLVQDHFDFGGLRAQTAFPSPILA